MTVKTNIEGYRKEDGTFYIYGISYDMVFERHNNYAEVTLSLIDVIGDDADINDVSDDDRTDRFIWDFEEESLTECLQAEGYSVTKKPLVEMF